MEIPPPIDNAPPPTAPGSLPPAPQSPRGNDKIWSILSHLSAIIGITGISIILPLVVYLVMRDESEYVAANAKEALNFHISLFIYSLCCIPLIFLFLLGIPALILIAIGSFVLAIVAAVKAADGGVYHYPLTLRLVQ